MSAVLYCPSEECVDLECSAEEPCCEALCGPCPASDCHLEHAGSQEYFDGTSDDLVYCHTHKTEAIKR